MGSLSITGIVETVESQMAEHESAIEESPMPLTHAIHTQDREVDSLEAAFQLRTENEHAIFMRLAQLTVHQRIRLYRIINRPDMRDLPFGDAYAKTLYERRTKITCGGEKVDGKYVEKYVVEFVRAEHALVYRDMLEILLARDGLSAAEIKKMRQAHRYGGA